jgi:hypothetical protein
MNESEFNLLRESSWRRPLTPAEEARLQAYLGSRPEAQQAWEADATLNQFLTDLPNAPVSSNFTSRVLDALDRENSPRRMGSSWLGLWQASWLPRLAWVTGIAGVMVLSLVGYRHHNRTEMARGLDLIVKAMPPEPAILQDFDTIQRWAQSPVIDQELWVALNQPVP